MAQLLKNGRVFVSGHFETCDVLVEGETIAAVGADLACGNAEVVDCAGKIVVPGLTDMHVHLREPGFEYKETIKTGSMAAARGGFTTVCPMPNLDPVPDSLEHLRRELDIINKDAVIHVLPFAAITVGEKGQKLSDIEDMAPYCIGFSDDGKGVQKGEMMEEAMRRVRACGSFISAHCEDESLLEGGAIHKGEYARLHGMKGISSESETAPIVRDIQLAVRTGCRYHVDHISAKESIEAVRQGKAMGAPVTCEATPHHIALCDMDITEDSGRFKMNPPLRDASDREAIRKGLQDGTIDVIATDHAPHSAEEKARGLEKSAFGTVGSETAFSVCYTTLVLGHVLTLEQLIEKMAVNPARLLGRRAVIAPGEAADLAVFDLEREYVVDPADFLSMGRSTPFEGRTLHGVTELTVCGGRVVYQR